MFHINAKRRHGRETTNADYEVRPRKHKRGFDLISNVLPFSRLWYGEPNSVSNAIDYGKFYSRSHNAVIRVYDSATFRRSTSSGGPNVGKGRYSVVGSKRRKNRLQRKAALNGDEPARGKTRGGFFGCIGRAVA